MGKKDLLIRDKIIKRGKDLITDTEKIELFDQLYDLIDERNFSDLFRTEEFYTRLELEKGKSHSIDDIPDDKVRAKIYGQLIESEKNDKFMEQLTKLTINRTQIDILEWHNEKFYEKQPKEKKEKFEPSLFWYFKDDIDLLKKNMKKDHPLIRHLMLTYCLRHKIRHNEEVVRKLFLLYGGLCPIRLFPSGDFYQTPKELYSALRKRWDQRDYEEQKIREAIGNEAGVNELKKFFTENIKDGRNLMLDRKKQTTFPSFERDFLPVFLPK